MVFDFGDGIGVGVVDFAAGVEQADRIAAIAEQDVGLQSVENDALTGLQGDSRQGKRTGTLVGFIIQFPAADVDIG